LISTYVLIVDVASISILFLYQPTIASRVRTSVKTSNTGSANQRSRGQSPQSITSYDTRTSDLSDLDVSVICNYRLGIDPTIADSRSPYCSVLRLFSPLSQLCECNMQLYTAITDPTIADSCSTHCEPHRHSNPGPFLRFIARSPLNPRAHLGIYIERAQEEICAFFRAEMRPYRIVRYPDASRW